MLFEFQHKDSKKEHYLFGTMHIQDSRAFVFTDLAISKMKECNLYVGEMDLGSVGNNDFKDAFLIDHNKRLDNFFSSKKIEKFKHIVYKSFGIDLDHYMDYVPMFIMSVISTEVYHNDRPFTLDAYLHQKAVEANLSADGLETMEEQYLIAKKLDYKNQLKAFTNHCKKPDRFRKQLHSMLDSYVKSDFNALYKKGKKTLGVNRKILLHDRNLLMIHRILTFCQNNTCFISVGAGHLAGDKGIISGLKKSGYRVRCIVK